MRHNFKNGYDTGIANTWLEPNPLSFLVAFYIWLRSCISLLSNLVVYSNGSGYIPTNLMPIGLLVCVSLAIL